VGEHEATDVGDGKYACSGDDKATAASMILKKRLVSVGPN
jgi:hypothetical protein